jgi:hypothetical protein
VRLSELLAQEDFKRAGICVIGRYKTDANEYSVLGRSGQLAFPPPKIYHLILYSPENEDPEIEPEEVASIKRKRRFGLERQERRT